MAMPLLAEVRQRHQAISRKQRAGDRPPQPVHRRRRGHGARRSGRRGQDDADAPAGRADAADRRTGNRLRRRHANRNQPPAAPGQLHAAAIRPLRRPDRRGEPEALRRSARRCWHRTRQRFRAAAGVHRPWPVHRAVGRQALGRHEAKARAGLRPDPHAPAAAARRAQRRRRSDLAPRAVADGL